ncbi:MAG: M48 family metalloprotease [Thermosphaera sp.]
MGIAGRLTMSIPLLLVLPIISIVIYIFFLWLCSNHYLDYLEGGPGLTLGVIMYLLVLAVSFSIIALFIYNAIYNSLHELYGELAGTITFILYFIPIVMLLIKELPYLKCNEGFDEKINDLQYTVCKTSFYNAWYNASEKRFYISELFYRVLSRDEIYAVMLHENGHTRIKKWLNISRGIVTITWYFVAITIAVFIMLLLRGNDNILMIIGLIGFILPFTPAVTTAAMVTSWIVEHEADLNALKGAGYKAIASSLLKLHVYGSIEGYSQYVEEIRLNLKELEAPSKITLIHVLKTLFKYSWNVPLHYFDFIRRPLYYTHPPLEFRIYKLFNEWKHVEREKGNGSTRPGEAFNDHG